VNARALERFPEVARALAAAPAPAEVGWLAGPTPALVIDGVQLASRVDARAEAVLQARLVPERAERATLYGFAQGELARVLLARPALRALDVVVLCASVARAVLERCPAEWLADPRVRLLLPAGLDELAPPCAASPADLRLADDEGARLRDLVVLELATPLIRRKLGERERARAENEDTDARCARDAPVEELFGSRPGARLCVAAAGPTLARHYRELAARAHELVAVDAALKPLLAAGIAPAFAVSQDGHEDNLRRLFALPRAELSACTLVYLPAVPPAVLESWPGPRRAARAALWSSGSVVHAAVDLARALGARRIELFGADFATPAGQSHVAGAACEKVRPVLAAGPWVRNGRGARVATLANLVGYLRDLERYIARHPELEFVNRCADGAAIAGARLEEASRAE